jgi:hypothetical protein
VTQVLSHVLKVTVAGTFYAWYYDPLHDAREAELAAAEDISVVDKLDREEEMEAGTDRMRRTFCRQYHINTMLTIPYFAMYFHLKSVNFAKRQILSFTTLPTHAPLVSCAMAYLY